MKNKEAFTEDENETMRVAAAELFQFMAEGKAGEGGILRDWLVFCLNPKLQFDLLFPEDFADANHYESYVDFLTKWDFTTHLEFMCSWGLAAKKFKYLSKIVRKWIVLEKKGYPCSELEDRVKTFYDMTDAQWAEVVLVRSNYFD